jgi:two-component system, OmpR family, alkaline phosphatase synthesis response regulator PhoP
MPQAKKILIMDIDPDHLLFCTLVFQRRGYEVLCLYGCSPDEFPQILTEFTPDLIFLDHQMRGISGPEVIRILRSLPKFSAIPVVYFSAEEDISLLAKEAGADAHLKRPFTIHRLLEITSDQLGDRSQPGWVP